MIDVRCFSVQFVINYYKTTYIYIIYVSVL